jgi:hypothetical protein
MAKLRNRGARRLGVIAAVVLGVAGLMTTPASAHDNNSQHYVAHGATSIQVCWALWNCDYAQVWNSHHTAVVGDEECDNHSVRAEYYRYGVSGMRTLHGTGCHTQRTATDWDHPVTRIRVCEETKGCSSWHNT